jgi:hypothetical protein
MLENKYEKIVHAFARLLFVVCLASCCVVAVNTYMVYKHITSTEKGK